MIEPASACNTPQILADGTDDVIMLLLIAGDVQLLDSDDRVVRIESWRTAVSRYLDFCRANDIEPRNITSTGGCTDDCRETRGAA